MLEIGIDKGLERMYKKEREGGIGREKSNKEREREPVCKWPWEYVQGKGEWKKL